MTYPDNHRSTKSYINLTGFRGRLVAVIVTAGFVGITFNAFLFYAYVVESYGFILRQSTLPEAIIAERYAELYGIAIVLAAISIVMIIVVAAWTLYITQRVAGPVYHLQKVIESIKSGNSEDRLRLRAGDEFQDLAKSFNELIDDIQHKS